MDFYQSLYNPYVLCSLKSGGKMNPMLNIAVRAARRAGNILMQGFERRDEIESSSKGSNDYVTNFDKASEKAIVDVIRTAYPDHTIITEESGLLAGKDDEVQWIIDPLDGTTNFIKGFPHFAVSIAIRVKNRTEAAVVYNPVTNELFTAQRGKGAKMNELRLRVENLRELKGTILATGFPFKRPSLMPTQFAMMASLAEECADFRRTGSAALDLCYVAANRVDGYFEADIKPWDIAAGDLIAREAGALVCDFNGMPNYLAQGHIVATAPRLMKAMLNHIQPCLPQNFRALTKTAL